MESLHHEFSVLSRAVDYKNISAAAENIGLSQPQISRIVAKIESELDVLLLDRVSKRSSTWTAMAHKLSKIYRDRIKHLNSELQQTIQASYPKFIRIATLEGLVPFACELCKKILDNTNIHSFELNVFDLSILEEQFAKHNIDLVFTSREPGHRKYSFKKHLGFQNMNTVTNTSDTEVFSTFEYNLLRKMNKSQSEQKQVISNSLYVRKLWMENYNASGRLPSPLYSEPQQEKENLPVLLLAQDNFNHQLWRDIETL